MTSENAQQLCYRTDTGVLLPGVSPEQHAALLQALVQEYALSSEQICEAASYSLAMVVRVALGLSADQAKVTGLAGDHINGWSVLAALRHLANAGTEARVMLVDAPLEGGSENLARQLAPLRRMGISIEEWTGPQQNEGFSSILADSHAAVFGLFPPDGAAGAAVDRAVSLLNELRTPVHAVQAPTGVDLETGARRGTTLFASSTMSLGVPLRALAPGSEYCGRLYLCDISLPADLYRRVGPDIGRIFSEQPVVRIFPA